jgi:hypothetical protein
MAAVTPRRAGRCRPALGDLTAPANRSSLATKGCDSELSAGGRCRPGVCADRDRRNEWPGGVGRFWRKDRSCGEGPMVVADGSALLLIGCCSRHCFWHCCYWRCCFWRCCLVAPLVVALRRHGVRCCTSVGRRPGVISAEDRYLSLAGLGNLATGTRRLVRP